METAGEGKEGEGIALIPQFYSGRTILITGATGFMGKVLVERLLSTCPGVDQLVLLLRAKRGAGPDARLAQLRSSPVFDVVRRRNPAQLDKLRAVAGDIAQPGLGLGADAVDQLREVSVVFHCAATVKFDEALRRALELNVLSVMRLLEIADRLPKVAAFIHVSTGYSNAERQHIEERVYAPPRPLQRLLADALACADARPEEVKRFISPKPNTYTFTKSLAEAALQQHGNKGYPLAIVRPTIVISSLEHPFPGWVENHNGPSGVSLAMSRGVLRAFQLDGCAHPDLLPVDMAADVLIAVGWETAVDNAQHVRVYNSSTCGNPVSWARLTARVLADARARPPPDLAWYPDTVFIKQRWLYNLVCFVTQTLPLHAAERAARLLQLLHPCKQRKTDLIRTARMLQASNDALHYFSTGEWRFATERVRRLCARLSPADRRIYNIDPMSIDWDDCFGKFTRGIRRYLGKHGDDTLPAARARYRRIYLVHRGITILFPVLLVYRLLSSSWSPLPLVTVTQMASWLCDAFVRAAVSLAQLPSLLFVWPQTN